MKFNIFVLLSLISLINCQNEDSFFDQINSSPVLPTMIQYVVVPAVQAHSSQYFVNKTKEIVDNVSRWQTVLQEWASALSMFLNQIAQLKIDFCGQKLLCTIGKAKFISIRDQKRSTGNKIIESINSIFSLPSIEQKFSFAYLEARDFGASGGNCDSFPSLKNCPVPSSAFENIFFLIKQLF